MATRLNEMTIDDFDAWCEAQKKFGAVAEAADETGGPRLSLVPAPEQNDAWPTDLLPAMAAEGEAPVDPMPFDGVALPSSRNRLAGWSAERQRLFLTVLAETGSVHLASAARDHRLRDVHTVDRDLPQLAAIFVAARAADRHRAAAQQFLQLLRRGGAELRFLDAARRVNLRRIHARDTDALPAKAECVAIDDGDVIASD